MDFEKYGPVDGKLAPAKAKEGLLATGVATDKLRQIWELSDVDKDGALDKDEFSLALYLCALVNSGQQVPTSLEPDMIPPSKRLATANPF